MRRVPAGMRDPDAIKFKPKRRTNHTEEILLRRDLHALMDAGKLEIVDGFVVVEVRTHIL